MVLYSPIDLLVAAAVVAGEEAVAGGAQSGVGRGGFGYGYGTWVSGGSWSTLEGRVMLAHRSQVPSCNGSSSGSKRLFQRLFQRLF